MITERMLLDEQEHWRTYYRNAYPVNPLSHDPYASPESDPVQNAIYSELGDRICQAYLRFDLLDRKIAQGHLCDGLSYDTLTAKYGVSKEYIQVMLHDLHDQIHQMRGFGLYVVSISEWFPSLRGYYALVMEEHTDDRGRNKAYRCTSDARTAGARVTKREAGTVVHESPWNTIRDELFRLHELPVS